MDIKHRDPEEYIKNQKYSIEELPFEIISQLLNYLDGNSKNNAKFINKLFNKGYHMSKHYPESSFVKIKIGDIKTSYVNGYGEEEYKYKYETTSNLFIEKYKGKKVIYEPKNIFFSFINFYDTNKNYKNIKEIIECLNEKNKIDSYFNINLDLNRVSTKTNINDYDDNLIKILKLFYKKNIFNIKYLDISYNRFNLKEIEDISEVLFTFNNIKELNISNSHLIDSEMDKISEIISKMKSLKSLDLSGNEINDIGIKNLYEKCKDLRLNKINLHSNNIGTTKTQYLGAFLKINNTSLQHLDVSYNSLEHKNLLGFSKALLLLENITEINLCSNYIDDKALKMISNNLINLKRLRVLDLSHNQIKLENHNDLLNLFDNIKEIEKIDMSHNYIGIEGSKYIIKKLSSLKKLKSLNFSSNQMRSDGILGIIDSLKHRKLDKLDLSFNYVKSNKKESVASSLREIKNIDNLKV